LRAKGHLDERDLWACTGPNKKAVFLFDGASNEKWSSPRIAGGRYASVIGRYVSSLDGVVDIDVHRADVRARKISNWATPLALTSLRLAHDGTEALIDRSGTAGTLYVNHFGAPFDSQETRVDGSVQPFGELATAKSRLYWLNTGLHRPSRPVQRPRSPARRRSMLLPSSWARIFRVARAATVRGG